MSQGWAHQSGNRVIITIQAAPRASLNTVQGLYGDALKVKLHAPPVDGKANEALIDFLGKKLKIPKNNLTLKNGANQRRKIVAINGLSTSEVEKRLLD